MLTLLVVLLVKELDSFPFGRSAECGLFAPLSKTVLTARRAFVVEDIVCCGRKLLADVLRWWLDERPSSSLFDANDNGVHNVGGGNWRDVAGRFDGNGGGGAMVVDWSPCHWLDWSCFLFVDIVELVSNELPSIRKHCCRQRAKDQFFAFWWNLFSLGALISVPLRERVWGKGN